MKTHMALEDYLEAMLIVEEKYGFIRSLDVANLLGVKKPSVTYTTKRMKENGFINMDENFTITLTDSGRKIAEKIYNRHKKLIEIFVNLGVDEKTAREDACKVEHDLSEKTFEAICKHALKDK